MLSNLYFLLAAGANAALVTQYVHVTRYIYEDVHVYVDNEGKPVSTSVDYIATTLPVSEAASTSTISLASTTAASSGSALDAGAFQYSASVETSTTTLETSPEVPTAAAPTTTSQAPAPTSEAPAPTSEAPAPTSEAPAPTTSAAPTSTSEAAPTTPAAPTSAPAPTTSEAPVRTTSEEPSSTSSSAAPTSSSSSSSGSGETFDGQATYYDVGLGACGITNTDEDLIVALNVDQFNSFGAMSNGNPVCNRKLVVSRGGKSVTVTVTDKCPGCKHGDLDLSPAAFNQIASEAEGRVPVTWQWA